MLKRCYQCGVSLCLTLMFVCLSLVLIWLEIYKYESGDKSNSRLAKAGVSSVVGMANQGQEMEVKEIVYADDARLKLIEAYLAKYKSPLLPYSQLILDLSDMYQFDYRWIVAIGQQESNLCKKIPKDSYNCWGYGIHAKGTLKFDSYELALKSFASYLKKSYFDKGLDTPELMMTKYCPHSNGSWAFGVKQFFADIELGE